jgi:hypothetical protein
MRTLLVAVLALALAPTLAEAGGGSKPNSNVRVQNQSSDTLGVAVDPSTNLQNTFNSTAGVTSTGQFTRLGGKIVGPNASITIPVRAGTHTISATLFGNSSTTGITSDLVTSQTVTVSKGKTATVTISGNAGTAPTITVSNP